MLFTISKLFNRVVSKLTFMFKNLFLLALVLLTSVAANAQFDKGQKVLAGSIGFYGYTNDYLSQSSSSNTFNISPSFGWFLKPNLLQGLSLGYSYSEGKSSIGIGNTHNNQIKLGFFCEKFFPISQNFFFSTQALVSGGYSFGSSGITDTNPGAYSKKHGYLAIASLSPKISYRINQRWLLAVAFDNFIQAAYSQSTEKTGSMVSPETKLTLKSFNLSTGFSSTSLSNLNVGFVWLLKRK